MGILNRLFRIGKSEANAAVDKLENPEKMSDQIIRELQENYNAAIEGQAEIKATALQHRAEEQKYRQVAEDWERKANELLDMVESNKLTPEKGDELANAAAKSAQEATQQADQYATMASKEESALETLSVKIRNIKDKIEDTKNRAKMLKSKAKIADTSEKINKALSNADVDGLMGTLERMEEKVSAQEFKAQAYAEAGESSTSEEIDKVLNETKSSNALDALKAKRAAAKATN